MREIDHATTEAREWLDVDDDADGYTRTQEEIRLHHTNKIVR